MLQAFRNDPAVKEYYLARIREHAAHDEIIKGTYWQKGKGCAVGCTIHSSSHSHYETCLGIPTAIAWMQDSIFENLPNADAMVFPEAFLLAIPVGADLSLVMPRMMLWLMSDNTYGAKRYMENHSSINRVIKLYKDWIETNTPNEQAFIEATDEAFFASRVRSVDKTTYNVAMANELPSYAFNALNAAGSQMRLRTLGGAKFFWQAARDQLLKLLAETKG